MTHADVRRRLSEYLEGDLSERDEARVRAHLEECSECGVELVALRRAVRALHELAAVEPPHDLADAVMARVRAGEARPRRVRFGGFLGGLSPGWLVPLAAAAGLGAIAVLEGVDGEPRRAARAQEPPAPVALVREAHTVPRAARGEPARAAQLAAVPHAAALPPIASCLEATPRSGASAEACAAWYSWFVAMALEDTRGFVHEVDRLPVAARDPLLRRVAAFARRSGSAPLVGQQLRTSRDPRAATIASRFDYGPGVRQAGWTGR